ncbi:RNA polymerase sigma factor [Siccirubricoccus sp. G192]|uniref:RNA polymerase sigma factor n=1 Tax=Siccirubricoccus sp. G192 TaxID=2849651 RepID=UPI001C2C88BB|nr:RNA polymerase sigma factor [Siccirubricoccus sp. G192]MBV1796906.1 RNA polymerase sigma factor [Siccirubricoccus sp. G192]
MRGHQLPRTADEAAAAELGDGELVALARRGEAAAFCEIMRRNNRHLFRAARGVLRDDTEAEDVVQEAYVRAFRGLAGFRGEASLSTWLTRIALNEALGRLRRRRNTVGLEAIEVAQEGGGACILMFPTAQAGGDPEGAAARREVRRLLEGAIDELPEAFRLVLVARDVDGMSVEETARILGIRPETVRTRLHRARRLLRAALDQRLGDTLREAFPFDGARCARMTEVVLARLGLATPPPG